jgi:hypothetical protein
MWVVVTDNQRLRLRRAKRVAVVAAMAGRSVLELDDDNEQVGDPILTTSNGWLLAEALLEARFA